MFFWEGTDHCFPSKKKSTYRPSPNREVLRCFKQENVVEMTSEARLQMAMEPHLCLLEDSFLKPWLKVNNPVSLWPSCHETTQSSLGKNTTCTYLKLYTKRREGITTPGDSSSSWIPDPDVIWLQLHESLWTRKPQVSYFWSSWFTDTNSNKKIIVLHLWILGCLVT